MARLIFLLVLFNFAMITYISAAPPPNAFQELGKLCPRNNLFPGECLIPEKNMSKVCFLVFDYVLQGCNNISAAVPVSLNATCPMKLLPPKVFIKEDTKAVLNYLGDKDMCHKECNNNTMALCNYLANLVVWLQSPTAEVTSEILPKSIAKNKTSNTPNQSPQIAAGNTTTNRNGTENTLYATKTPNLQSIASKLDPELTNKSEVEINQKFEQTKIQNTKDSSLNNAAIKVDNPIMDDLSRTNPNTEDTLSKTKDLPKLSEVQENAELEDSYNNDDEEIDKDVAGPKFDTPLSDAGMEEGIQNENHPPTKSKVAQLESTIVETNGPFQDTPDSHFFFYFLSLVSISAVGYVAFHNKNKILALVLEGRRGRQSRRRPNSAGYRKLDTSLEEAMMSHPSRGPSTHVIY